MVVLTPAEEVIRQYIGTYSRDPFQRILSQFLGASPSREDIAAFASRNPDRWVTAIHKLALLSGYVEKVEIETTINVNMMSDAEIEAKLKEISELLASPQIVIEHMPAPEESAVSDALAEYENMTKLQEDQG